MSELRRIGDSELAGMRERLSELGHVTRGYPLSPLEQRRLVRDLTDLRDALDGINLWYSHVKECHQHSKQLEEILRLLEGGAP